MNKIGLIIQREFLTRVKKKSFIIMTLLTPILMGALMILPGLLASMGDTSLKKIAVVDRTHMFVNKFENTDKFSFIYIQDKDFENYKANMADKGVDAILVINDGIVSNPKAATIYSNEDVSMEMSDNIESRMEDLIKTEKLRSFNIENLDEVLEKVKTSVNLNTIKLDESGNEKETNTVVIMGIAYLFGFLMYMFIFMFGSQVMRGVIEEKTNRIVEVIISSVKPMQLMMGKIIGVAAVGLVQFTIWVLLSIGIFIGVKSYIMQPDKQTVTVQSVMSPAGSQHLGAQTDDLADVTEDLSEGGKIMNSISERIVPILFYFVIFFIGGYLLYSSLFAAIGAAVDNETETQQFLLPITIPLIIALVVMMHTFQNPNSAMSFWFSIIPFTSPIIMMARVPFEIPTWEIWLSIVVLYATIVATIWVSAKIYRTGILMYGKKTSFKELAKWIRRS